jgi:hypothetical protein
MADGGTIEQSARGRAALDDRRDNECAIPSGLLERSRAIDL